MKSILVTIALLIGIVIVWDGARAVYYVRKSAELIRVATPYSRAKPVLATPGTPMRILVLGDSTAVGTGATKNSNTTAGRLGSLYPDAEVVNISQNGLKIAGLLEKMNAIGKDEYFDIILIQIGANDIIRFTDTDDIDTGIAEVLKRTEQMGTIVLVLHGGDIGESRFFPWYIRPFMSQRSNAVREIYKKHAVTYHANYIDLIDASISEALQVDPNLYYASDLLHLNDEGYGLWFDEIRKKLI